ncbi:hypothetical protein ANANG_G00145020 [Anguilla anguilla]|uniref:BPTI/Kunitz inhibitor domain-containing protein n=1 Tax=Anguilla anguilla TaxID=7936 RepID=A0A9D3MDH6_ANGAN|nr:hypothetical protein ANANG_G00145020 [Anguilla anguilla]
MPSTISQTARGEASGDGSTGGTPALFSGLTSDPCLAPMSEGSCTEYILQWYHHGRSGECRPFLYGGCGGNHNRFATKQACQRRCEGGKRGEEETHILSYTHC